VTASSSAFWAIITVPYAVGIAATAWLWRWQIVRNRRWIASFDEPKEAKMLDPVEAEVCKRRGHDGRPEKSWNQCKWCGTWYREVATLEERADEPPEAEQNPLFRLDRRRKNA
jgi:hypothetical protein